MITLSGIHKSFGSQTILDGVDLEIPDGDRLFIVGGSGTGKSVLTKLILGLEKPDQGIIKIDGKNTAEFRPRDWQEVLRQFGVVFQGAALFDSLTVLENVGIKLYEARQEAREHIRARVIQALQQVNLDESILPKYPSQLSGGMRKRVGIARAIIEEPRYLFYDEPTTGLDPASSTIIDDLIGSLANAANRTSIVITHDMYSVQKLARRVAMIYNQRLHFYGGAADFFESEDPIIRAFLARLD